LHMGYERIQYGATEYERQAIKTFRLSSIIVDKKK
jgi:hypothetical protein